MKKELKGYLHLFGIGCPVSTIDGIGNILVIHNKAVTVALKCINYNQELHGFSDGNGGLHRTYLLKDDYIKLILHHLSDITDEERLYFQNLCELEKEDLACIKYGTAHLTNIIQWSNGVHYLLSKHFDLFGLIEAGLAVNAAELKSVSSR